MEGRRYTRRGFLARVRLEPFGSGRIYPHEETLAGPKADRLELFQATAMNLSPVFGLYPDPDDGVMQQLRSRRGPCAAVAGRRPSWRRQPALARDRSARRQRGDGPVGPKPVFIADGHHRYETGLRYLEERRAAGEVRDAEAAPNFILMMLVSMSDPGLIILPTHRLISGFPDAGRRPVGVDSWHSISRSRRSASARKAPATPGRLIEADGGQDLLGFGTVADGVWQTARFAVAGRDGPSRRRHSPAWRGLAVSVLHVAGTGALLPAASGGKAECKYVHLLREVTDAVAAKRQVSVGRAGAARHDAARRSDRRQPGEDAAEINVFLSQIAQRTGVQPA